MNKAFLFACLGCVFLCLGMSQNMVEEGKWQAPSSLREFLAEEDNVKVSIKALTAEESEKYLKKDLLRMGYQPVEVLIENGSPDPYLFSPDSIDLPLIEGKKIAKKILYKSVPRSMGFRIASFFFWPMTVPSTIDSLLTNKSYRKLKKQLESRSVKLEVVPPYSSFHRVFFVLSENCQNAFAITLENQETLQRKVFKVEDLLKGDRQVVEALPTILENYYLNHEK